MVINCFLLGGFAVSPIASPSHRGGTMNNAAIELWRWYSVERGWKSTHVPTRTGRPASRLVMGAEKSSIMGFMYRLVRTVSWRKHRLNWSRTRLFMFSKKGTLAGRLICVGGRKVVTI